MQFVWKVRVKIEGDNEPQPTIPREEGQVPFVFVGTVESIANAKVLLEYHLAHLRVSQKCVTYFIVGLRYSKIKWLSLSIYIIFQLWIIKKCLPVNVNADLDYIKSLMNCFTMIIVSTIKSMKGRIIEKYVLLKGKLKKHIKCKYFKNVLLLKS